MNTEETKLNIIRKRKVNFIKEEIEKFIKTIPSAHLEKNFIINYNESCEIAQIKFYTNINCFELIITEKDSFIKNVEIKLMASSRKPRPGQEKIRQVKILYKEDIDVRFQIRYIFEHRILNYIVGYELVDIYKHNKITK